MEEAAHKVLRLLQEEAGDALHGVGYYGPETAEILYASEFIQGQYTEEEMKDVLEAAFYESFGGQKQEEMHSSELHATTRTFDDILNTIIPISSKEGVVFALDREGNYSYRRFINLIEEAVADDKLGVKLTAD